MYESEITQFLRELMEKNPELAAQQREARAMWWDKPVNPEEQRSDRESRLPQPPYVYFSNNK